MVEQERGGGGGVGGGDAGGWQVGVVKRCGRRMEHNRHDEICKQTACTYNDLEEEEEEEEEMATEWYLCILLPVMKTPQITR